MASSLAPLYSSELPGQTIRLLTIEPGELDTALHCSLTEYPLRDPDHPYHALSYVWGVSSDRKPIICNSHSVEVTTSLHSALHQYRKRGRTTHLWVDALCINQSNADEKTHQVRMMQDIYKQAAKVIIWLGDQEEHDEMAMKTLGLINAPWETFEGIPLYYNQDASAYDQYLAYSLPDEAIQAVSLFLQRPWFQRIWIVQEFLSARSIDMWIGNLSADPDTIFPAARRITQLHNVQTRLQLLTSEIGVSRLQLICAARLSLLQQTMGQVIFGLFDLMMATRSFKSTDPRDKMFALVGLAPGNNTDFVDYSMDLRSTMVNFSKLFLKGQLHTTQSLLDILSFATRSSSSDNQIPSWTVDWGALSESLFTPLGLSYPSEAPIIQDPPDIQLINDEVLHVRGAILDQVQCIVKTPTALVRFVPHKELLDKKHVFEISEWHSECLERVGELPAYPTGELKDEVFWRTLVCNRVALEIHEPPQSDDGYRAWVELCQEQKSAWTHGTAMGQESESQVRLQEIQRGFESCFSQWSQGRNFSTTGRGHMGWIPTAAVTGDHIVIFRGCRVPFVVRPHEDGYKLLGDCYVHGFMEGPSHHFNASDDIIKIY